MSTSIVNLQTDEYVRINRGINRVILQAHRDSVRIALSEVKPSRSNTAFHLLGGSSVPMHIDVIDTNIWALATSCHSSLVITEIEETTAEEDTGDSLAQLEQKHRTFMEAYTADIRSLLHAQGELLAKIAGEDFNDYLEDVNHDHY